jgi:hypothetical protein
MLKAQQAGQITPAQQAAADAQTKAGTDILNLPQNSMLSSIATQAYSAFLSGTLKPADQAKLDQSTLAAKQQVAQMLAQNGITDSSVLASQYQQIDNQAMMQKQTMLDSYMATGNSAFDKYVSTTQAGQADIIAGAKYVSQSLEQNLQDALQLTTEGIGPLEQAIQLQMQSDTQLQTNMAELMSGLAQAYSMALWANKTGGGGSGNRGTTPSVPSIGGGGTGTTTGPYNPQNPGGGGPYNPSQPPTPNPTGMPTQGGTPGPWNPNDPATTMPPDPQTDPGLPSPDVFNTPIDTSGWTAPPDTGSPFDPGSNTT